MGSGRLLSLSLRSPFRSALFGIGVNLGAVSRFTALHLFAGYRQNGVHYFSERSVFSGIFHSSSSYTLLLFSLLFFHAQLVTEWMQKVKIF